MLTNHLARKFKDLAMVVESYNQKVHVNDGVNISTNDNVCICYAQRFRDQNKTVALQIRDIS